MILTDEKYRCDKVNDSCKDIDCHHKIDHMPIDCWHLQQCKAGPGMVRCNPVSKPLVKKAESQCCAKTDKLSRQDEHRLVCEGLAEWLEKKRATGIEPSVIIGQLKLKLKREGKVSWSNGG